jgi:DNA-binding transcriptional MerR regulator
LARRLRDRGVPESDIQASMARIRYWLSLGASPARIRAFLQSQQGGDRPERPDAARPDAERPDAVRP